MPRLFAPRTLLALAVLSCAAGAASAQSSVSLYGLVDMAAGRFQAAGAAKTWKAESGNMTTSFIGFRGSEDLGGGLSARFALESFLRTDLGSPGRFDGDYYWARAAWVGLSGGFGTLSGGRVTNLLFVNTLAYNAFGDSFAFSPAIRQVLTPRSGMQPFYGDTGWSNAVNYASPSLGGFTAALQASLGEGASGATGRNTGLRLSYAGGPFAAGLSLQSVKNNNGRSFTPPAGFDAQSTAQLGLSWDLGGVKLFGQWSRTKTDASADTEATYYGVGASLPLGSGALLAQYGRTVADLNTAVDPVNKTLSLGYDLSLSKRTDLYAVLVADRFTGVAKGTTYAAGMRHRF